MVVLDPLVDLWSSLSFWYAGGMSICLLMAGFRRLCHASLNSRACLVSAWSRMIVLFQSNLWSLFMTWVARIDHVSSLLMAFLCSVIRDLIVFDVSSM